MNDTRRIADNTEIIAENTSPEVAQDTEVSLKNTSQRSETALRTQSQRHVNMIWEYTQSAVAGMVVLTTCIGIFVGRIILGDSVEPFPAEWWTIVGLVIGFYFGRTNHARMGDEKLDDRK